MTYLSGARCPISSEFAAKNFKDHPEACEFAEKMSRKAPLVNLLFRAI
jgi:hypothetical protein